MKSATTSVFFILLCISIPNWSFGQFAPDFEFLDHSHFQSYPGAMKTIGDNTYYVSHNRTNPMTSVHWVNANKELETILELPWWSTESKLFEDSDSSFQLVIHSLFEYDIYAPGFLVVIVDGGQIRTDTITQWGPGMHNGVLDNSNFAVDNIEKDSNGNWITILKDSLYTLNTTGIIQSTVLDDEISGRFDLTANSDGEDYVISHPWNGDASSVARIEGNDFVYLYEILSEDLCRNMLSHESGNFVVSSQFLSQFEKDFSSPIRFWNLSEFDGEVKYLDYTDNGRVEILTESDSHFSLYYISPTNDIELVFQENLDDSESILHFTQLSSEQYLFTGVYTTADITENTFIRNINIVDNSNVEYPSMNVAIEEFEVRNTLIDTFDFWINNAGDTVYSVEYAYEFNIELLNEEAETVDIVHAYSDQFFPLLFDSKQFMKFEGTDIDPFSSIEADSVFNYQYYGPLDEVTAVVPGANYMFNRSPNNTFDTKVITSTFDFKQHTNIDVYPNPTSDFINIPEEVDDIGIYNSNGQLVYYISKSKAHIDVKSFDAGIYYLKMRGKKENAIYTSRFIKL